VGRAELRNYYFIINYSAMNPHLVLFECVLINANVGTLTMQHHNHFIRSKRMSLGMMQQSYVETQQTHDASQPELGTLLVAPQ
jgi:hypothetical protein